MYLSHYFAKYLKNELCNITQLHVAFFNAAHQPITSVEDALCGARIEFPQDASIRFEKYGSLLLSTAPVFLNDELVCYLVLGGEDEHKVKTIPPIAVRLIRLLIQQEQLNPRHNSKQDIQISALRDLFCEHEESGPMHQAIQLDGKPYGINFLKPVHIALICSSNRYLLDRKPELKHDVQNFFHEHLNASKESHQLTLIDMDGMRFVMVSVGLGADEVKARLSTVLSACYDQFSCVFHAGISLQAASAEKLFFRYKQAGDVCQLSLFERQITIEAYQDSILKLMIARLPTDLKQEFVELILPNAVEKDIASWKELTSALYRNAGSISQAANELFIHKNTLQYRLNNIAQQTKYDPRNYHDAVLLQMAFLIHDNLKNISGTVQ